MEIISKPKGVGVYRNRAICCMCGDSLTSSDTELKVVCGCGGVIIWGGFQYIARSVTADNDYIDDIAIICPDGMEVNSIAAAEQCQFHFDTTGKPMPSHTGGIYNCEHKDCIHTRAVDEINRMHLWEWRNNQTFYKTSMALHQQAEAIERLCLRNNRLEQLVRKLYQTRHRKIVN